MNGGWYVIGLNLQEYAGMLYPVGAGLLTLGAALLVLRAALRRGQGKQVLLGLIPFAVIFCIPFAWIIVIQHHSALHARFTFRIISVAVTAVCCMGLDAWQRSRVKYGKN